ncbi:Arm DNA-binding domain-containing protein [Siphonobacter sp. SORGH_AS_0500]|uniref:Arm DNA-binding domain-containing protein n=1 Tax=Siphonobacter sp. SORGH_AS_0500 TaxID=1864824 RepID=UPI0028558518|nr:Arm DNA-binding domain-containing protein [Siphonobacter sp. SORGH_AS_0500]MDR6193667.1 hypothetical protein [Siphonobacter sp. SORGH_AS_0500]
MTSHIQFLFYLSSQQTDAMVHLQATLNGNPVELGPTGIRVHPQDWDALSQRLKGQNALSEKLNAQLAALEAQLHSFTSDANSLQQLLTPDQLKKIYSLVQDQPISVASSMKSYLEWSESMQATGQIEAQTHLARQEKLALFMSFLSKEGKADLMTAGITSMLLERFKTSVLLNGKSLVYAQKCQQMIITLVHWSFRSKLVNA